MTAAVACLAGGPTPLVITLCGDDLLGTPAPGLLWRIRERAARAITLWAGRRAAAMIAVSDNLRLALPPRLRAHVTVMPNGVDTDTFRPMDRSACRAALGWSAGAKYVLFNASHGENQLVKNLPLARAAVDLAAARLPHVQLQTMSKVPPAEVPRMMNAADCLIVTSLHEGSPNIVKEAMACNLPIVSVLCGDVLERLKHVRPGAVRPYEAPALADALVEVLQENRRSNGREALVAQGLTAEGVAVRVTDLYRAAAGRRAGASMAADTTTCAG